MSPIRIMRGLRICSSRLSGKHSPKKLRVEGDSPAGENPPLSVGSDHSAMALAPAWAIWVVSLYLNPSTS